MELILSERGSPTSRRTPKQELQEVIDCRKTSPLCGCAYYNLKVVWEYRMDGVIQYIECQQMLHPLESWQVWLNVLLCLVLSRQLPINWHGISKYSGVCWVFCVYVCVCVIEGYQPLHLNKSLSDSRISVFWEAAALGKKRGTSGTGCQFITGLTHRHKQPFMLTFTSRGN